MANFIKVHPEDQVAVALNDLKKGEKLIIDGRAIILKEDIPMGHKIALRHFNINDDIIKYGYSIGRTITNIEVGAHVHTHNLKTNLKNNLEYEYNPKKTELNIARENKTFSGYLRSNGDAGIRNELWIVPTVGCVNGQAGEIIKRFKAESDTSHIDAIEVLSHPYGCSQLGDDFKNTKKALVAAIKHPNAGGVLILSLGCENNQLSGIIEELGEYDQLRIKTLIAQDVEDEVEEGLKIIKKLSELMKHDKRTDIPLSKLRIGLKCGGSDGFSGITANPLLGRFSDWLIAQGGTTVLCEVPEMFGAETILMNRAKDRSVFEKIVALINGFKDYFRKNNQVIYENPSPGNKEGGISTLEDKSLGNVQKGGTSPVVDVLSYGEQIKENGLNLLWSPGNDLVSTSALAMSGCQMVLFTTGRGTPFGSFVPTMKISTNSKLFNKKKNWIDFNAGSLLNFKSMDDLMQEFVEYILIVSGGKKLKHEINDSKEIDIFKSGVTL